MNSDNLALRPNCLLTKYPLVFITGKRSLFHHEKLGGELQDFIAAHGYVVMSPAMPFRNKASRYKHLESWLKNQKTKKFHFILGEQSYHEFAELLKQYPDSTKTLTAKNFASINTKTDFLYRLHEVCCKFYGVSADPYNETLPEKNIEFYNRFLDHCIELAENDVI